MCRITRLLGAVLAVVLVVLGFGARLQAQDKPPRESERVRNIADLNERKIDLELKEASIREALEALFRKANVNRVMVLEGPSRGRISLGLRNAPFEGALVSILRSVKAPYLAYDGNEGMVTISPDGADTANKRFFVDVEKADVRYLIKALLRSVRTNYAIDESVSGSISLKVDGLPFEPAFERILKQCRPPARAITDEGVLLITAKS